MEQTTAELVQRFFERLAAAFDAHWRDPRSLADALRNDDLDPVVAAAWEMIDPEIVWSTGDFGTYTGALAVAAAWDEIFEVSERYDVVLTEVIAADPERAVVSIDRTIRGKGSGIEATIPAFIVVTFSGDRVVAADEFAERSEALESSGIRPSD